MATWLYAGQFIPSPTVQEGAGFDYASAIFKAQAFSSIRTLERFCYLRIRYTLLQDTVYSRWFRFYPSFEPILLDLELSSQFPGWTKSVQCVDFPDVNGLLYPPLTWQVQINVMGA